MSAASFSTYVFHFFAGLSSSYFCQLHYIVKLQAFFMHQQLVHCRQLFVVVTSHNFMCRLSFIKMCVRLRFGREKKSFKCIHHLQLQFMCVYDENCVWERAFAKHLLWCTQIIILTSDLTAHIFFYCCRCCWSLSLQQTTTQPFNLE